MSRRRVPRERGTPSHSKPGATSRPEWRPSCNVSARQSARLLASGDIRRELVEGQCGPADGDDNPEPLDRMRTRGWDAVRGVDRGRGRPLRHGKRSSAAHRDRCISVLSVCEGGFRQRGPLVLSGWLTVVIGPPPSTPHFDGLVCDVRGDRTSTAWDTVQVLPKGRPIYEEGLSLEQLALGHELIATWPTSQVHPNEQSVYPICPMCLGSHRMTLSHESTIVQIFECRAVAQPLPCRCRYRQQTPSEASSLR